MKQKVAVLLLVVLLFSPSFRVVLEKEGNTDVHFYFSIPKDAYSVEIKTKKYFDAFEPVCGLVRFYRVDTQEFVQPESMTVTIMYGDLVISHCALFLIDEGVFFFNTSGLPEGRYTVTAEAKLNNMTIKNATDIFVYKLKTHIESARKIRAFYENLYNYSFASVFPSLEELKEYRFLLGVDFSFSSRLILIGNRSRVVEDATFLGLDVVYIDSSNISWLFENDITDSFVYIGSFEEEKLQNVKNKLILSNAKIIVDEYSNSSLLEQLGFPYIAGSETYSVLKRTNITEQLESSLNISFPSNYTFRGKVERTERNILISAYPNACEVLYDDFNMFFVGQEIEHWFALLVSLLLENISLAVKTVDIHGEDIDILYEFLGNVSLVSSVIALSHAISMEIINSRELLSIRSIQFLGWLLLSEQINIYRRIERNIEISELLSLEENTTYRSILQTLWFSMFSEILGILYALRLAIVNDSVALNHTLMRVADTLSSFSEWLQGFILGVPEIRLNVSCIPGVTIVNVSNLTESYVEAFYLLQSIYHELYDVFANYTSNTSFVSESLDLRLSLYTMHREEIIDRVHSLVDEWGLRTELEECRTYNKTRGTLLESFWDQIEDVFTRILMALNDTERFVDSLADRCDCLEIVLFRYKINNFLETVEDRVISAVESLRDISDYVVSLWQRVISSVLDTHSGELQILAQRLNDLLLFAQNTSNFLNSTEIYWSRVVVLMRNISDILLSAIGIVSFPTVYFEEELINETLGSLIDYIASLYINRTLMLNDTILMNETLASNITVSAKFFEYAIRKSLSISILWMIKLTEHVYEDLDVLVQNINRYLSWVSKQYVYVFDHFVDELYSIGSYWRNTSRVMALYTDNLQLFESLYGYSAGLEKLLSEIIIYLMSNVSVEVKRNKVGELYMSLERLSVVGVYSYRQKYVAVAENGNIAEIYNISKLGRAERNVSAYGVNYTVVLWDQQIFFEGKFAGWINISVPTSVGSGETRNIEIFVVNLINSSSELHMYLSLEKKNKSIALMDTPIIITGKGAISQNASFSYPYIVGTYSMRITVRTPSEERTVRRRVDISVTQRYVGRVVLFYLPYAVSFMSLMGVAYIYSKAKKALALKERGTLKKSRF